MFIKKISSFVVEISNPFKFFGEKSTERFLKTLSTFKNKWARKKCVYMCVCVCKYIDR